jgi:hypothetical protein
VLRRALPLLLVAPCATASGFAALIGTFWGFGLTCDDTCGTAPPWRDDPNAWQWGVLAVASLAVLATGLLLAAAVAFRRPLIAGAVLVSWTIASVVFLSLFDDSGLTSHVERGWVGVGALFSAAAGAIALSRRGRKGEPRARRVAGG